MIRTEKKINHIFWYSKHQIDKVLQFVFNEFLQLILKYK